MKYSANLGFLWTDRTLPEAIQAAAAAGFAAVECHYPYDTPAADVVSVLEQTGLPMLGINTRRGERDGDNGLAAIPDRGDEAQAAIDEAVSYAAAIGAKAVHVMAGKSAGTAALDMFKTNLVYATGLAEVHGITILIEPLNAHDAPGYFLSDTQQACDIITSVDAPNLKLMFDCYHVGRTEPNVIERLRHVAPHIGHIQFASVPDRGAPDHGAVDYAEVFAEIKRLGWTPPLGAEYRPAGDTEASLGWMSQLG